MFHRGLYSPAAAVDLIVVVVVVGVVVVCRRKQPGCDNVAFYREVPLGQENAPGEEEGGGLVNDVAEGRRGMPERERDLSKACDRAAPPSAARAPASASSLAALDVTGRKVDGARRAAKAASTLKPRM